MDELGVTEAEQDRMYSEHCSTHDVQALIQSAINDSVAPKNESEISLETCVEGLKLLATLRSEKSNAFEGLKKVGRVPEWVRYFSQVVCMHN